MSKQVITGTMVLITPPGALDHNDDALKKALHGSLYKTRSEAFRETVKQAVAVHQGPVVVLPHGWAAMPAWLVRAQLDAVEREIPKNIGPSKPPPPPPPPG